MLQFEAMSKGATVRGKIREGYGLGHGRITLCTPEVASAKRLKMARMLSPFSIEMMRMWSSSFTHTKKFSKQEGERGGEGRGPVHVHVQVRHIGNWQPSYDGVVY